MNTTKQQGWIGAIAIALLTLLCVFSVRGAPSGAQISGPVTVTGPTITPGTQNTSRGTITSMLVTSIQQDNRWKAYVGNVTGQLLLENPSNYSIYSWDLTSITGQVYASRYNNLTWTSVACASQGLIANESIFFSMNSTNVDRINATFNWTIHKAFSVAGQTIASNTCNSTVTYVNSSRRVPTTTSTYQEILLQDANGYMVYLTDISKSSLGYDTQTYDFQMIVADNLTTTTTPYYFYAELFG